MNAALLASAFSVSLQDLYAAADDPSTAKKVTSGPRIRNAPITRVARVWEQLVGGAVAVSDRAQPRRVSMHIISPSSKDELRKMFIAALRENGIYVIERADDVLFDTEPVASLKN